jgi:hypothetical protein
MPASQIKFVPAGRGFVRVEFPEALHYAEQGRMVGSDDVDVENARILNLAAKPLNLALSKLAGS